MPLPVQGDKLLPGQQHIIRGGSTLGAPHRAGRDHSLNPISSLPQSPPAKLGDDPLRIGGYHLGKNIDQSGLYFGGIRMAQFQACELLEVIVQQPWMMDHRLQNKRLPARNDGSSVNGTCGELWACGQIAISLSPPGRTPIGQSAITRGTVLKPAASFLECSAIWLE